MIQKGVVVRFGSRGFGWIQVEASRESVFFHVTDVVGQQILQAGDRVQFQVQDGNKGRRAILVRLLSAPDRLDRKAPPNIHAVLSGEISDVLR